MHRTTVVLALLPAAAAAAQTNIDPSHKLSWSENTGWMNWRDAGGGTDGVRLTQSCLSGWIWSENLGWITVGQGPANGHSYTNAPGDFGVNIAPAGDLSGLAWGENIGWINFTTLSLGDGRARADLPAGRLRGHAWGENIGWISLDHPTHFVGFHAGVGCYPNCDASTTSPVLNVADFTCFLQRFASGDAYANCDQSTTAPSLNVADFTCYLQRFAAGCN